MTAGSDGRPGSAGDRFLAPITEETRWRLEDDAVELLLPRVPPTRRAHADPGRDSRRAVRQVLDWLACVDGSSWQARWVASGAVERGDCGGANGYTDHD